jgi:hypothetical protein
MSKQIVVVNPATDTFDSLISKTNELINAVNTEVVTVNSTSGATIGNGFVTGIFGANTLVATTIRGGNVGTTTLVTVSSNLTVSGVTSAANVNSTGVVNASSLTVGTSFIANTIGAYHTGTINAASITLGATLVANTLGVHHTGTVNAASFTTSGFVANTTAVAPTSNTVGSTLGTATQRWSLTANTVATSGALTVGTTIAGGNTTITGFVNASAGVNSSVLSVGATFTANATLVNAAAVNVVGQVNTATLYAATSANVGTAVIANSIGVTTTGFVNATGVVNSSAHTIGTTLVATTTGVFHTGTVNAASLTTTNFRANTTGVYPLTNSAGQALGNTIARWELTANTIAASGAATLSSTLAVGNTTVTGFVNATSSINALSHTVGATFTANSTMTNTASLVVSTNTATIGNVGYFTAGGNVGIGNATPTTKLSVEGTTYLGGGVTLLSTLTANGSVGTSGQVLTSNSTGTYWAAPTSAITNVAAGNGLTGGGTSGDLTITVGAGAGMNVSVDAVGVLPNTGIVANTTGVFVNAAYIATIAANSATYLGTQPASFYTNASNLSDGTVPTARLSVGNSSVAGILLLSNDYANTTTTVAASAKALNDVWAIADAAAGGTGAAGGDPTNIQFNQTDVLSGSNNFTFDVSTATRPSTRRSTRQRGPGRRTTRRTSAESPRRPTSRTPTAGRSLATWSSQDRASSLRRTRSSSATAPLAGWSRPTRSTPRAPSLSGPRSLRATSR